MTEAFRLHFSSEYVVAPSIEPATSGSVARNSDLYTTEAVGIVYWTECTP
jgi:hypothetical protein